LSSYRNSVSPLKAVRNFFPLAPTPEDLGDEAELSLDVGVVHSGSHVIGLAPTADKAVLDEMILRPLGRFDLVFRLIHQHQRAIVTHSR
jgi:hypothetical protein